VLDNSAPAGRRSASPAAQPPRRGQRHGLGFPPRPKPGGFKAGTLPGDVVVAPSAQASLPGRRDGCCSGGRGRLRARTAARAGRRGGRCLSLSAPGCGWSGCFRC